jgi:hypothetical protein
MSAYAKGRQVGKTLHRIFAEEELRKKAELREFVAWANDPPLRSERSRDRELEREHPGARPARIEELGSHALNSLYDRHDPPQAMEVCAWL